MEILIALIPAFAWGSIGLVSGKLGGTAQQQTLGLSLCTLHTTYNNTVHSNTVEAGLGHGAAKPCFQPPEAAETPF